MANLKAGLVLVAVLGSAALGYVAGARHSWRSNKNERVVVATVNGSEIHYDELEGALKLTAFPILKKLVEQRLVAQEAERLGLKVLDTELPPLDPSVVDINSRRALTRELRTKALMSKILLRGVTEQQKREVFELFKDELTQYDVSGILLGDEKEVRLVQQVFDSGEGFDKIAARYSKDARSKVQSGRFGVLNLPAIEQWLGPEAADVVAGLPAGGSSGLVRSRIGPMFLKVNTVQGSYAQLKPLIELMLERSMEQEVAYGLSTRAKVQYTGFAGSPSASPSPTP